MVSDKDLKDKSKPSSSPVTGSPPPGRSRWWMSSSPPRGPSTLNTAKHKDRRHHQSEGAHAFITWEWRREMHSLIGEISSETARSRKWPWSPPWCGGSWPRWEPIGSRGNQTPASGGLPPRGQEEKVVRQGTERGQGLGIVITAEGKNAYTSHTSM